jgi:predicted membrane channel-forming protein YqfA (hemolysin III family)
MSEAEQLAELRELFLGAPESTGAQLLALVLSLALVCIVMWLVRKRTLRAEYTPIWMGVAFGLFLVGLNLDLLRGLARMLGAWTISSTVFFLGEFFLLAICLNYAVRLSQAGTQIRRLAQELALLRQRVDELSESRGIDAVTQG